jgi:hypothetical protein
MWRPVDHFDRITAAQILWGPARQYQVREQNGLSQRICDVIDDVKEINGSLDRIKGIQFRLLKKNEIKSSCAFSLAEIKCCGSTTQT